MTTEVHCGVTGSRDGAPPELVGRAIHLLLNIGCTHLHHGDATPPNETAWAGKTSVDRQVAEIAAGIGIVPVPHPPDWQRYPYKVHGLKALHVRNREVVEAISATGVLVALPGGRGTASTVALAERLGKRVEEVGR